MSPAEILAHAVRKAKMTPAIKQIPIQQIEEQISVPVKAVESAAPVFVTINQPEPAIIPKFPSIARVVEVVAEFYGISQMDLVSERRTLNIVRPRQIACYLCRILTPRSWPFIGRTMGGRDHTTVLFAFRKIERLLETDDKLRADIEQMKEKLVSDSPPPETSAPAVPTPAVGATL